MFARISLQPMEFHGILPLLRRLKQISPNTVKIRATDELPLILMLESLAIPAKLSADK